MVAPRGSKKIKKNSHEKLLQKLAIFNQYLHYPTQVRFADVARGGLRVVAPTGMEAHVAESRRHFGECVNLAWAQQLKNKDLPGATSIYIFI